MTIDILISLAGIVVPVASAIASALNQHVRDAQAKGQTLSAWLLHLVAVVNAAALNGDKVVQLVKLVRGGK